MTNNNAGPSPRPFIVAGYSVIAMAFGVAGVWAATAKLDRAVIAPGVIEVASNRKEVQHLEGGIIHELLVREGQEVKKGDILLRLNDVQAAANLQVLTIRQHIAQATEARLLAERRMDPTFELPENLLVDTTPEVRKAVADQREIFQDRASILTSQINILSNRIDQLQREMEGLEGQKEAFRRRAEILSERLERLRPGLKNGSVQKNLFASYEEEHVEVQANVARMDTEKAKVEKSIGETEFQILQAQQQYKERASSEYKEVNGQLQELLEQRKVAENVLARTRIAAPVDGVAQNLRFHTAGGVIKPGEILLEVVPLEESLVINAHVAPIDMDSVRAGLKAEVKFSAFPGRFMPIVIGEVDTVSRGSITPPDGRSPPYFLARINVNKGMVPDDVEERLSAGMPAEVLISTGERTVLDYLTSPLTDAIRRSMRED
ncbi:HlyD family type I secretion periplasmic adaptor subunit [Aerobium aerolatum]|uniref:Membrane fusion protein (MFP) family protein n=1 Tax=Aquamicrobium aerolatum DSM 21857 TaxID=1121003 RepID=A0A1I3RZ73_9HYPH|nr:HlyD family type I secretion periplasmic adaptor subunit [Aquamicrobium aerolatum]SFJ51222.1 HlyD family secretion protein [Aquamicrobium aerolatum DSM 21857]